MSAGRARHGEREQLLLDHAVAPVDLDGLTDQRDRHFGGDLAVGVDDLEVDVRHAAPHRVALQLPRHGQELLALHLEREDGVEAGLGAERGPQIVGRHRDGNGADTGAVHHGGDPAVVAQATGGRRAAGPTGFGDQGELGHGRGSSYLFARC